MASLNLNTVILCGRLTTDVELKSTPSGTHVCTFTLAVNRRFSKEGEQQADFISVVAWKERAEFISKYFKKGASLCITGSIQTRSWKDQNGNNRYATEVVAEQAMFVDSKSEGSAAPSYDAPSYSQPATAPKFEELKTDDDLPF